MHLNGPTGKGKGFAPRQSKNESDRGKLLKEYSTRNISNTFKDKRIKEGKEPILDRFTNEFKKNISKRAQNKKKFSLSSTSTTEIIRPTLTHKGISIENDFGDFSDFSSEEDSEISASQVHLAHFGGGEKRSKAEVMREVITKSKRHRSERQAQHAEDEVLGAQLDADFDSIRNLLLFREDKKNTDVSSRGNLKLESNANKVSQLIGPSTTFSVISKDNQAPGLSFDNTFSELSKMPREAAAHNRTLSPSETVAAILTAETDRLIRMQPLDASESSEEDNEISLKSNLKSDPRSKFDKANENLAVRHLEIILDSIDLVIETPEHLCMEIEKLENLTRSSNKEILNGLVIKIQKILFDDQLLFGNRLWMISLIIERLFSVSDTRHSIGTLLILTLSRLLSNCDPNKQPSDTLRGALLLLRLAGPRRWLAPEALHILTALAGNCFCPTPSVTNQAKNLIQTKFDLKSKNRPDNPVTKMSTPHQKLSDLELFFGQNLLDEGLISKLAAHALTSIDFFSAPGSVSAIFGDISIETREKKTGVNSDLGAPSLVTSHISQQNTTLHTSVPLTLLEKRLRAPRLLEPVLVHKRDRSVRSMYRKELRGAVRELRKDTHAISVVKNADARARRNLSSAQEKTYTLM